jgi:hypothetical protein
LSANDYDIDYFASVDAEGVNIVFDADRILTLNSTNAIDYCPDPDEEDGIDKSAENQTKDTEKKPAQSSILPLTISAYGNRYVIKEFTFGKGENGKTTVTVTGTGFGSMPIRNGSFVMPVICAIVVGGKEYTYTSAEISASKVTYSFNVSADPETVVFYPGDNKKSRTEIDIEEY